MIKSLTVSLCLFCFSLTANAQLFEGEVIYHNTYVSRTPGTTDQQYNTMLGNTQNYFIKGGNYKYENNGTFLLWQLYIAKDKKIYSKVAHSLIILWEDVTEKPNKVTSVEYHKDAAMVLGYLCDEVILHFEANYQKYYFSPKLGVDSKLFANHLNGNLYTYLAKANAVPLKIVTRSEKYMMESTATQIKPMKLADVFFTLPPNVKTEKSMY